MLFNKKLRVLGFVLLLEAQRRKHYLVLMSGALDDGCCAVTFQSCGLASIVTLRLTQYVSRCLDRIALRCIYQRISACYFQHWFWSVRVRPPRRHPRMPTWLDVVIVDIGISNDVDTNEASLVYRSLMTRASEATLTSTRRPPSKSR